MARRQHSVTAPAGLELRVEVHWCTQCRAERTVQIVQLASDPEPIAICVECGAGVDMWLSAELVDPPAGAAGPHTGATRPHTGAAGPHTGQQGAA